MRWRAAKNLIAGFLYDPTRDEFFSAEHGAGAKLNGQPMHVSKTQTLSESMLGTGFPSHKRHKNPNIHFYHQLTLRSHGLRRAGSAALDLANVACGRYDGFWEFNLNPWDTAAGVLLVREAGGTVTRFDGSPFLLNSREVLASNGIIHEELMQNFAEIFAGRGLEEIPSPVEYARSAPRTHGDAPARTRSCLGSIRHGIHYGRRMSAFRPPSLSSDYNRPKFI